MTPHPHHPSSRVHVPTRTVRRSAAMIAAVLVIGGTPFVARAIGNDASQVAAPATPRLAERTAPPVAPVPDPIPIAELDVARAPEPVREPAAAPSGTYISGE